MHSGSRFTILPRFALLGCALSLSGLLTSCGGGADYDLQLRPIVAQNQSPFDDLDRLDVVLEHADGSVERHNLSGTTGSPSLEEMGVLEGTTLRLDAISSEKVIATGRAGPISLVTGSQDQNILVANLNDLAWLESHTDGLFMPGLVSVGDGRFLVFGGIAMNSATNAGRKGKKIYALELSDPSNPVSLEEIGEMPEYPAGMEGASGTVRARHGASVALLTSGVYAGKVLVAGGTNQVFNSPNITDSAFLFDPSSGEIESLSSADQMTKSHYLQNTAVDATGNVVVMGGWEQTDDGFVVPLNHFDFFDASAGRFDQSAKNRTLRGAGAFGMGAPLGTSGVVHCGGGMITQNSTWKTMKECTLITTSGEVSDEIPDMPIALAHGTMIALSSSELLVVGGVEALEGQEIGPAIGATDAVLYYDHLNQSWTEFAGLQIARASAALELLPDGRVLVLGGRQQSDLFRFEQASDEETLACIEIYDPFVGLNQPNGEASTLLSGCSESQSTNLLPTRAHSIATAQDAVHGIIALGGLSRSGAQPSLSFWPFPPTDN